MEIIKMIPKNITFELFEAIKKLQDRRVLVTTTGANGLIMKHIGTCEMIVSVGRNASEPSPSVKWNAQTIYFLQLKVFRRKKRLQIPARIITNIRQY